MKGETGKNKSGPTAARLLSVAMGAIVVVLILAVGLTQRGNREFGLGNYGGADIAALERAFMESGEDADLVELLKALCYRAIVEGDESEQQVSAIESYGTVLFDRARAGQTDLQALGDEDEMLELLGYIRGYGAK